MVMLGLLELIGEIKGLIVGFKGVLVSRAGDWSGIP